MASIYGDYGGWEKAEELLVQVLEIRRMVMGAEHLDTLMSMNNLAATYNNPGWWDKAEELLA